MNNSSEFSTQQPDDKSEAAADSPIDATLGATLEEDCAAVQEDFRQMNLGMQLAEKTTEVRHLKFLLDQMKAHVRHMQDGIVAMRKERHVLANSVLRAPAMDAMLARMTAERDRVTAERERMTAERDRLKNELGSVLAGLCVENAENPLRFDKRDKQIADLTFELVTLKQKHADLHRVHLCTAPVATEAPVPFPLKTSAEEDTWLEPELEIVATECVGGKRGKA